MKGNSRFKVQMLVLTALPLCWKALNTLEAEAASQHAASSETNSLYNYQTPLWQFTTPEYQRAAIDVLLIEANRIANKLNLREALPISRTNLVEAHISPPGLGMFGTISTSNYTYCASQHKRFSSVVDRRQIDTFNVARATYRWDVDRMNTNRAIIIASNLMAAAGMDIIALSRDCPVEVVVSIPDGKGSGHFLPIYHVNWRGGGSVEFLEPTEMVRDLSVYDKKYILNKPLLVPNITEILRRGNAPPNCCCER